MSKKKVSAPLSYDPGRGRPKEYLAYLNWQEMQALQRLNGGNMEFGPRGLPSFPPDDAIGSSQNAATGNWTGSPGGTTSTGAGTSSQGSGTSTNWGGSNNYGTDSSSWSGSGSNYNQAGTATASAMSSSAASSAASENKTDIAAQQVAAIGNAISAAKNNALGDDTVRAGIGSIEVGPMRTPVKIGEGPISKAVTSAEDSIGKLGQKYGLPSSTNYSLPAYSGEISAYDPSITEKIANYLNSNFYGDTIEGQQRANKIVDMATNAATTLSTIAVPEVRIPGIASSFIGSLAKPVVGFAERIAAPVIERIGGSGILKTTGDGEKIISDLDEFVNWASSLPGRNTAKFEIDISKIPQYKTLSDYKSAQPGIIDKAMDKIEGAIDMATEAARLGTGTVPRAFGSSMLGSYNETLNNAIHGDYNDYVSDYLSDPVRDGIDYLNSGLDYVSDYFNDPRDQKGDYGGMKDGGVVSRKKITAPLSYDPGKGRPKEYLAYLNWQEMQALQRLNGGNMERGPRGLPSFPPDDAIGSSQNASTGNWTGSPGGTTTGTTSTGTTSTGSSNYGTDPSSWSGSGGNYGGTSASTSSTAASSAASSDASSSVSANTSDTAAQQAAAVNNAISAAQNAALSDDARRAGIGSIEVGPMRTPVKIGSGAISAAVQAGIQQAYSGVSPTMPGGGGMGQLNARRGSLTTAVGPSTGVDAFGNIATGSLWGTSPSVARRYDSLESDLARRSLSEAFGAPEEQESYYQNAPSGVFGPRMSMDKTYYPDAPSGATIGPRQYSTPSLSEFDNYPSEFDGIGGPTDRAVTQALKDKAYGAYKAISDYFSGQPSDYVADVSSLPQLKVIQPEVRNPSSMRVVGGLGIASLPGSPQSMSFQTNPRYDAVQRDYEYGGGPKVGTPGGEGIRTRSAAGLGVEDQIDLRIGPNYVPGQGYVATNDRVDQSNTESDPGRERVISVENVPEDLTTGAENEIINTEEQYREQPNGTVGQYTKLDVAPGEGYITHLDGTPFTAEDIANLPPDIKQEYMDKMRWARMTDEPYPLTTEQKIKVGAVGAITRPITGNPLVRAFTTASDLIGTGLGYLKGPIGEFGEQLKTASEKLSKPAQAVADYESLNPLQKAQLAANAGQTYQYGTGTSVAGGPPVRELGGKDNQSMLYLYGAPDYPNRYTSYREEDKRDVSGLRKQYRLWDMGIGIPEPGDPDYNDYMKYLKSRGTSAQV